MEFFKQIPRIERDYYATLSASVVSERSRKFPAPHKTYIVFMTPITFPLRSIPRHAIMGTCPKRIRL